MNPAQSKNQEVQQAIQQQIQHLILLIELLQIIQGIIPGFVWTGWGSGKRVDQTTESDLEGLTDQQASEWANAVTTDYTETTDH